MDGRLGMAAVHSPDCNCKQRWRDSNLPVFSDGISWRVSPSVIITTIYCVPWVFFSLKNNNNNNKPKNKQKKSQTSQKQSNTQTVSIFLCVFAH